MADNEPVGTTFTYQARLTEAGEPASGTVDLVFRLFDVSDGGTPLSPGGVLIADDFEIGEDGRFTIDLDFGDHFTGAPRWLEIDVNGVTLSPRQPIMASPHAMVATTAANVPTKALIGTYSGITGVGTLDSLNVSGNVGIDAFGEARVELPEWVEAINRDFRCQLTCSGGFAPVYIAAEIENSAFHIAGGTAGLKVSWRIEAVRNDLYVREYGAPVEIEKPDDAQGRYLHPELFTQPPERGIHYRPSHDTPTEEGTTVRK